jgi:hypothetical protein
LTAIAKTRHRPPTELTFAGLAHLIGPAETIADLGALTAAIDAAAREDPDNLHETATRLIGDMLCEGRAKVRAALAAKPHAGLRAARSYAHISDVVVAGVFHY